MSRRTRTWALLAVWCIPSLVFVTITWAVYATYRIETPAMLSAGARTEIMSALRAALVGQGSADRERNLDHPELSRALDRHGPVVVSVWLRGNEKARVMGRGATLAVAVAEAADALAVHPDLRVLTAGERGQARIKVDIVVGRGPLARSSALASSPASEPVSSPVSSLARSLGIHPGLEGLGVSVRGIEALLLPDDLIRERLHGASTPLAFVPDFRIGMDFEKADKLLARRAQLPAAQYGAARRAYFRFRTDSFVEPAAGAAEQDGRDGAPLPLSRGMPPRPELSAASLRAAAIAGGHYLVAHLGDNGRYIYERELTSGQASNPRAKGNYSIPRHAGTTYFLAELYRLTGEQFLREPIERAFAHLQELIVAGGCRGTLADGAEFACVVDRGHARTDLGSTALTVVALAEYQRATGDGRYRDLARQLTEWILYMQRPDGSFAHVYDVRGQKKDQSAQLLYYSGEAALALARMHAITGQERYRDAAERALDHLIGWYDFFLGGYFYGEEHWTCIAAEALYPAVTKDAYRRFCSGYAAFQRAQQVTADDYPDQRDYAGAYNFTPYMVPQNTPAGSRTEAVISAYLLGRHMGQPEPAIRAQIMAALHYTLGQQIRADSAFSVSPRVDGQGAVPATPVDRTVRIDYVQHVCSAMIRAVEIIESPRG